MENREYTSLCRKLINEILSLEKYDYFGFEICLQKFQVLGKKDTNHASTEEGDKIEVYIENSMKAKNATKKAKDWNEAKTLLIENIEIWIGL